MSVRIKNTLLAATAFVFAISLVFAAPISTSEVVAQDQPTSQPASKPASKPASEPTSKKKDDKKKDEKKEDDQ